MKSLQSDAPPARRPAPEVWGNVLGKGQAVLEGSGSVGGVALAAAGTSLGMSAGTVAEAVPAWRQSAAAMATSPPSTRLMRREDTTHLNHVRRSRRIFAGM